METITTRGHSISSLEHHMGYWLRLVSNNVSGAFARSLQARQISVAEWVVMRHLYERDAASPSELAEALRVTRGAISKIVDKLESKQWIAAKVSTHDSRAQRLCLTRQGRRVLPEIAKIADQNDRDFFGSLSADERADLERLLRKLANHHQMRDVPLA